MHNTPKFIGISQNYGAVQHTRFCRVVKSHDTPEEKDHQHAYMPSIDIQTGERFPHRKFDFFFGPDAPELTISTDFAKTMPIFPIYYSGPLLRPGLETGSCPTTKVTGYSTGALYKFRDQYFIGTCMHVAWNMQPPSFFVARRCSQECTYKLFNESVRNASYDISPEDLELVHITPNMDYLEARKRILVDADTEAKENSGLRCLLSDAVDPEFRLFLPPVIDFLIFYPPDEWLDASILETAFEIVDDALPFDFGGDCGGCHVQIGIQAPEKLTLKEHGQTYSVSGFPIDPELLVGQRMCAQISLCQIVATNLMHANNCGSTSSGFCGAVLQAQSHYVSNSRRALGVNFGNLMDAPLQEDESLRVAFSDPGTAALWYCPGERGMAVAAQSENRDRNVALLFSSELFLNVLRATRFSEDVDEDMTD